MSDISIFIPISIAVAGVLVWLLIPKRKSLSADASTYSSNLAEAVPTAKHYGHFPQIRQALAAADSKYLKENAPPQVAKQALRERRAVALRFLRGLHDDFSNLARLGRMIATLSPEVSRQQETERLILTVKFQMLYALVWLRLSTGYLALDQLELLTGLIGRIARRTDEAMAEISALSTEPLPRGFGV
jgi:hypothetical protein